MRHEGGVVTAPPRPWLVHVDVDDFMVQVERAADPRLTGRAVVIGGATVTTGVVAAASREARQAGVRAGMLLAQARHRCPEAAYVAGAMDRYLAATAAIDEILRRDADTVDWLSLDEAVVVPRVSDSSASELRLVLERIRAAAHRELGLALAVGAAGSRTAARIAARLARPSGVLLVLSGYEERFLAPLDLALMAGLSPSLEARLRSRGIGTLGELAAQAPDHLRELLGPVTQAVVAQARGQDAGLGGLGTQTPRSLSRTIRCSQLVATLDDALPLVRVIVAELVRTARARGYFARGLSLRIEGHEWRSSRSASFRVPTADDGECTSAAVALTRRLWRVAERRPVHTLCGTLLGLSSARGQLSLFEPSAAPLAPLSPANRTHWHALWTARAAAARTRDRAW